MRWRNRKVFKAEVFLFKRVSSAQKKKKNTQEKSSPYLGEYSKATYIIIPGWWYSYKSFCFCYKATPCNAGATDQFTILELQNPSIDVSELYKARQSQDFGALNCEVFGQGVEYNEQRGLLFWAVGIWQEKELPHEPPPFSHIPVKSQAKMLS